MDATRFADDIRRLNAQDLTAFEDYLAPDLHRKNGMLEFTGVEAMKHEVDATDRFSDILVAYNSFVHTDRDGQRRSLGIPH